MPGKALWLLISLVSLLDAARPATSRRAREVRSFARVLSEEWAKRGESDLAWDGVLGKGLLLAVSAAMTPAAAVVANVGRIDLPGELGPAGPLGEELDLDALRRQVRQEGAPLSESAKQVREIIEQWSKSGDDKTFAMRTRFFPSGVKIPGGKWTN